MRIKLFLAAILGLCIGVGIAIVSIIGLAKTAYPINQNFETLLGIKRPKIIGFLPYWLLQKADKNYNQYITTLSYFGLTLDSDGRLVKLVTQQEEEPGWTTLKGEVLKSLLNKAETNHITTSLLIHASNESTISALIKDPQIHARNLVSDITPLMKTHGFIDLNLDVESFLEASQSSQEQFSVFVKELKQQIDKDKLGTLTVEINPTSLIKKTVINPTDVGEIADYIVLMAYDYHYSGSYIAGPVAPVGGAGMVSELDVATSIEDAIKIIPANKIILGIPLYGYEWETVSSLPGAPTIVGTGATASQRRTMKLLSECNHCTTSLDPITFETVIIFPDPNAQTYHQIYYGDSQSLVLKLRLANQYNLGGVALWALGYEDQPLLEPLKQYKQSATLTDGQIFSVSVPFFSHRL